MHVLDPEVDEFLKKSDSLVDQSHLPEQDLEKVEHEAESLKKRWNKVKNDVNSRQPRFVKTKQLGLYRNKLTFYWTLV